MQALILAGGEGTRLRPLTSTVPKPVVPLVDRPFIAFMIDWLRGHGVDDVVMSCGHLADGRARRARRRLVASACGCATSRSRGRSGTGGALKFAEELLDERFLMLNGDVLTDLDVTAQLAAHERPARGRRSRCTRSRIPSAYGLVRLDADGVRDASSSRSPRPTRSTRNNISAGVYVLETLRAGAAGEAARPPRSSATSSRDWSATASTATSSQGYWKDIGTPERYLEATFDILEGIGRDRGRRADGRRPSCASRTASSSDGRIVPSALVERGCRIGAGARIGGRAVLEHGVTVGEGTTIESAVVMAGRRRSARTARCAGASSPPASGSATTA